MNTGALNLLVFREARRCVSAPDLKRALAEEVCVLNPAAASESVLRALLRAGEIECGVADSGFASAAFEQLTDQLADALVGFGPPTDVSLLRRVLDQAPVPEQVSVSVPEGFAYYALHPLRYAEIANRLPSLSSAVVVIGIRSIGTTLSAVTAAAAKKTGRAARRLTVRPAGHPYNRKTQFAEQQLAAIRQGLSGGADFLVVDEGPGLSGSSFLSVAEALLEAGAPRSSVTLICGHNPDFDSFCCDGGPERARQFRWVAASGELRRPAGADVYIGGGEWRKFLLPEDAIWPAAWINFERVKFLSAPDAAEPRFFKFLGLGHYGDEVFQREKVVADGGFGPPPQAEADGFASSPQLSGRSMVASDLNESALVRIAEYCSFRQRNFPHGVSSLDPLQQMAEHNLAQVNLDIPVKLELQRPVLADGRMQPHEWLLLPDGVMLKTDSGSHGDDHFFPGPTDIAWDLAGAIVEWGMDERQADFFLEEYDRLSGDKADQRIGGFLTAYAAFRHAYCLMAANALQATDEKIRLYSAADNYKRALVSSSAGLTVSVP